MNETGGGARDNDQYAADNGGANTGDTYSYGTTGTTERALGSLRSGTLIPTYGAYFTNNTGTTITSIDISYRGEQWRLGSASRTDALNFEYSLDATDLVTGTWISVSSLNFVTPNTVTTGAKDGNASGNNAVLSATISGLSIADGSTLFIRWIDTDASGADDGLAVDDFSLTPQGGVVLPDLTIADVSMNEGNAGTTSFDFTVSLSAPAGAGGVTFDIATADGSALSASDYVASALTGQTIAAGNSSYTFSVLVNGDVTIEPNDTFYVNITNITGANATDTQALGIIVDDEAAAPVVTMDPVSATFCNGETVTLAAQATGNPAPTVQWQVSTDGGTNWSDIPSATGNTYVFTITSADSANMYHAIFTNSVDADTTADATLLVNPTYLINESFTICSGTDYTFPDGSSQTNITATVLHVSNLQTTLGCDSLISTTINVNPVYNLTETVTVCPGNNYTFPDGSTQNNITATSIHTSSLATTLGCDSIIVTTVNVSQDSSTIAQTICAGDSVSFFGNYYTIAGSYYHTLTNMMGCDSIIELELSINALPTVTFDYMNDGMITNVCAEVEDTLYFTQGLPAGGMYMSPYGAGDTLFPQFVVDNFGAGTYAFDYVYTDPGTGCTATATDSIHIAYCIGIKETQNILSVNMYPNPAHANVTITVANNENAELTLMNTLGQKVYAQQFKRTVVINLNEFAKGIYYVRVKSASGFTIEKLIIE